MHFLSVLDIIIPLLFIVVLFIYTGYIKNKRSKIRPEYVYFRKALMIKIFGALSFGLIYIFYYRGGDTTNYYESAVSIENLMYYDFDAFYDFMMHQYGEGVGASTFFNHITGYPIYRLSDDPAIFTSKFYMPLVFLSGNSYFGATVLSALVSFFGLWKLYNVFVTEFPAIRRELFISIFVVPSVFFWGSGIMKDSIVMASIGWYVYSFYWFFIRRNFRFILLLCLGISMYLIISIKPYVLFALLPGSIIWLSNQISSRFHNRFLRIMFTPLLLGIGGLIAYFALNQVGDMLGLYKLDTVVERASVVNKDMKMEYYGGKSFDIGNYDPSVGGMLSVSHKAVFAALFRPTILDTQNIVMLFSALENTYILILTVFLLIRLKIIRFFRYIGSNPLLLFSVLFSIFFAFSVGISISNFGSLVRLRIPALPFFVSSLFILRHFYEKTTGAKRVL